MSNLLKWKANSGNIQIASIRHTCVGLVGMGAK